VRDKLRGGGRGGNGMSLFATPSRTVFNAFSAAALSLYPSLDTATTWLFPAFSRHRYSFFSSSYTSNLLLSSLLMSNSSPLRASSFALYPCPPVASTSPLPPFSRQRNSSALSWYTSNCMSAAVAAVANRPTANTTTTVRVRIMIRLPAGMGDMRAREVYSANGAPLGQRLHELGVFRRLHPAGQCGEHAHQVAAEERQGGEPQSRDGLSLE
jgi:hypothetical protein